MDIGVYVPPSTVQNIQMIIEKIVLTIYAIVLVTSVIQTFLKNKYIDRLFASINEGYSDGKFQSNKICFHAQMIQCYRFDNRFSYIPNANRSILFIIATHIQVLVIIAWTTSINQGSELVSNCSTFSNPYEILQCENSADPCQFDNTEIAPKCFYYYFSPNNLVSTVTSMISWHYGLRYLVIKLVLIVRWILFRDNDQPRKLFWCCQLKPCRLRCLMYLQYVIYWIYLFSVILCGFLWNISWFHMSMNLLKSVWIVILMAVDLLLTLSLALAPELIQNWLDGTANGVILRDFESKGLLLDKTEQVIHIIKKKKEFTISTE